jgi:hypothetical protein
MSEVKSMEAFRDALTELGRAFTQRAISEEQAANLVLWLALALLDRERRSWTTVPLLSAVAKHTTRLSSVLLSHHSSLNL